MAISSPFLVSPASRGCSSTLESPPQSVDPARDSSLELSPSLPYLVPLFLSSILIALNPTWTFIVMNSLNSALNSELTHTTVYRKFLLGYLVVNVVQFLSHIRLFAIPWTTACQAPLSSISWSLLKFMYIGSVMLSNHLIFCHPLLFLPSVFPSIRVFSNESSLRIRWPKYWSFSFSISPSNDYSGLISFRIANACYHCHIRLLISPPWLIASPCQLMVILPFWCSGQFSWNHLDSFSHIPSLNL